MKKQLTEIVFILDRSGSMCGLEADTIGGFNSLIAKQKKEDGEALILKDLSEAEDAEAVYAIVEDETELDSVFGVFEQMLEDVDIER